MRWSGGTARAPAQAACPRTARAHMHDAGACTARKGRKVAGAHAGHVRLRGARTHTCCGLMRGALKQWDGARTHTRRVHAHGARARACCASTHDARGGERPAGAHA
mmetsp:Transcript_42157/g.92412  ORF Transcript_42157/g.92412 Transcript_42157/m.92412 type:complete len:106 (-) Transcript_42157:65-382(-)